jgi:hypothetical protein
VVVGAGHMSDGSLSEPFPALGVAVLICCTACAVLSAWESDRSRPLTALTRAPYVPPRPSWTLDSGVNGPSMAVTDRAEGWLSRSIRRVGPPRSR